MFYFNISSWFDKCGLLFQLQQKQNIRNGMEDFNRCYAHWEEQTSEKILLHFDVHFRFHPVLKHS